MLRELHIENVAVIERADLELGPGLNILTGETGAGKSILVDAMHAILGARASRELVRTGAEKAVVCATFDPDPCQAWCEENEIECDDELIIRRQITCHLHFLRFMKDRSGQAFDLRRHRCREEQGLALSGQ